VCAMDEAIDSVWVCPPSFFIHFLLKKRNLGFFFSLFFFVSCFSKVSCLFVCVFVVRGGVICVACIIILYSRTDAIHFKRFY
jgi:hypothetical protein